MSCAEACRWQAGAGDYEMCADCGSARVVLSGDELHLLREALDSHAYWQVSEENYRKDGFVYAPGADDVEAAEELQRVDALSVKLGGEPITGTKEGT